MQHFVYIVRCASNGLYLGSTQDLEGQLAHAERSEISTADNFTEDLPERRTIMQAWADYLDGLKARAEVIALFGKA